MKKFLKITGIVVGAFLALCVVIALVAPAPSEDKAEATPRVEQQQRKSVENVTTEAQKADDQIEKNEPTPEPAEPEMTSGQENAVESAESYLEYSGFSREGLIQQLSSDAGEGFAKADASFAVNHVDVNWNEEAVESAQDYLDYSSFSSDGLIEQLSSSAGEGFTLAQAQYAVDQVY
jgi:multidrug efflux pump subunit AcrB